MLTGLLQVRTIARTIECDFALLATALRADSTVNSGAEAPFFADFTDDGNADHLNDYYYTFLSHYDSDSYNWGQSPGYRESYNALSYTESDRKISANATFTIEACVRRME